MSDQRRHVKTHSEGIWKLWTLLGPRTKWDVLPATVHLIDSSSLSVPNKTRIKSKQGGTQHWNLNTLNRRTTNIAVTSFCKHTQGYDHFQGTKVFRWLAQPLCSQLTTHPLQQLANAKINISKLVCWADPSHNHARALQAFINWVTEDWQCLIACPRQSWLQTIELLNAHNTIFRMFKQHSD